MFTTLTKKLNQAFRSITGSGVLSEKNIQEGLREIRLALLEADVHFGVVKTFIAKVQEKAIGIKVLPGVSPSQQFVQVVHDELTALLGGSEAELNLHAIPSTIMVVGLQGSGKTTSLAKMALYLKKQKKKPYLVPLDVYRPAAIEQLQTLGAQIDVPVYPTLAAEKPLDIAKKAYAEAVRHGADVILIDTAGRLHIDAPLMQELAELKAAMDPQEILFVADAMIGQEAANVAQTFHDTLGITGVIFTKTDGDARGGAILSIKYTTGVPVQFIGTGEKITDFERFYPDRIANRILGMGDVLSLIEKAQEHIEQEEIEALEKKFKKASFTFEDFLKQLQRLQNIGSLESIVKMLPGGSSLLEKMNNQMLPENELKKTKAIIQSMTKFERNNPDSITASRKRRIAQGSGTTLHDINNLIKNFDAMKKTMQSLMNNKGGSGFDAMKNLFGKVGNKLGGGMQNMLPDMSSLFGTAPSSQGISKSAAKRKKEKRKKERKKRR